MALYAQQDIEVDDGGEIQFENGDLAVASVKRSHLQILHWLVACNRDDTIDGDAVGDLGAWFGRLNIGRNHRAMEDQLRRALIVQGHFLPGDVRFEVVPVSETDAAVTARLFGEYAEPSADLEEEGYAVLGYVFPFSTGRLERVA